MDWYSIVKFFHIVTATLWVGGGFVLFLLDMLAERAGNIEEKLQAIRASGRFPPHTARVFRIGFHT